MTALATGLASLGQTKNIGSTTKGAASGLTHTSDNIGAALDGLANQTQNACHFY
jgi:hypothetical protein